MWITNQTLQKPKVAQSRTLGELAVLTTRVVTYGGVDEAQEDDCSNDGPHGLHGALLETLRHHLVQAVTHAPQLGGEPGATQSA